MVDPAPAARNAEQRSARRRGQAVVMGLFGAAVTAFIVSSTWQIWVGVYGTPRDGDGPAATQDCRRGVRNLARAVERARTSALAATHAKPSKSADQIEETFVQALSPEWDEAPAVERACGAPPNSTDAFAAVMRLRKAEEGLAQRDATLMTPVWKDVQAYFP